MPCQKPKSASKLNVLLLTALAVSVTACATNSPPAATKSPTLPAIPSISTPLPSVDYSISAQQTIQSWRDKLKATPLTFGP